VRSPVAGCALLPPKISIGTIFMLIRVAKIGDSKASMTTSQDLFALKPDLSTLGAIASFTVQIQVPFSLEANLLVVTPSSMLKPKVTSG